ncbi:MAG TPA: cytidylate kinase-like family protein [Gemmatimonadales bacterium]|jgi:cytidylate kinase
MTDASDSKLAESSDRDPIQLITLSREYGAGGSELGVLLGRALSWPVLDRDMAERIAQRLHCSHAEVAKVGERGPRLLERIASAFTVVPSDAPILPALSGSLDPDAFAEASRTVVLEAVRTPPLIIIGHGANCVLAGRADLLRIRVTAPFDLRVRRVAQRTGASFQDAAADVRHRDADRRYYLERYFRKDTNEPCLYDLQINSGTIALGIAARMVVSLVRSETALA